MIERSPIVSVIIPTYNREDLVRLAIQSVLNQTYQDFELIVVDDASVDNTQEVVKSINDLRIRYIKHSQNLGECATRNTGIKFARGEYIAFLDSDDEWLPEKLEKQVKLFQSSSVKIGAIYTWLCIVDEHNQTQRLRNPSHRGYIYEKLLYKNLIGTPSTLMVRRECFQEGVYFDPSLSFCGDWDMWLKLAQHYEFDFIPEVLVQYREHNQENRATTNSSKLIDGHLLFLKKYHYNIKQYYKSLGSFSKQEKAEYFFKIGKLLICHGNIISHPEAVTLGKFYLSLACLAYPFSVRFLFNYLTSLMGGSIYTKLLYLKDRLLH